MEIARTARISAPSRAELPHNPVESLPTVEIEPHWLAAYVDWQRCHRGDRS